MLFRGFYNIIDSSQQQYSVAERINYRNIGAPEKPGFTTASVAYQVCTPGSPLV